MPDGTQRKDNRVTEPASTEKNGHIPVYEFEQTDGIVIKGKEYRAVRATDVYHYLLNTETTIEERFSHASIAAMYNDPTCPIEHYPGRYGRNGSDPDHSGHHYLGDIPDTKAKSRTDFRIAVVERFKDIEATDPRMSRSDDKMEAALKFIGESMVKDQAGKKAWRTYLTRKGCDGLAMPVPRTVRNWLLAYEATSHPLCLHGSSGGRRENYFSEEEETLLMEHVKMFASEEKPSMVDLHDLMVEAFEKQNAELAALDENALRVPSLRTFQNRVNGLDQAFIARGRHGESAASAEYRATASGMTINRALQRVEMDEWRVDWKTLLTIMGVWKKLTKAQKAKVPRIRLYMTAAFDYASKALVAFRVHRESPSIMTVLATLEMVCMNKTEIAARYGCQERWDMCGSFRSVAADSATWYTNPAFRITVNDAGAKIFLPPAGAASARGSIERFFRTASMKALACFSGGTKGSLRAKGDYDADAMANLTFDQMAESLTRFFVDVYLNTPHDGLHEETPKEAWRRLIRTHRLMPPPTGRRRRHIFGINVMRMLGKGGVRFLGIPYQSTALQAVLRRKKQRVLIRVDQYDLGEVSVWNGEGWISVPSVVPDFKGMSIWTWRVAWLELRKLNLAKARLSRAILRKANADAREKAEIARLEAGFDAPILTEKTFLKWEGEMERGITIVKDEGNVPEDFMAKAVFPDEFYSELGIDVLPQPEEKAPEQAPDPHPGWIDPATVKDAPADKPEATHRMDT